MLRKLSAFTIAALSLSLAACSAPTPEPEPSPIIDQAAADAEMRSVKRDVYASIQELRDSLEEYGDLHCISEEEAKSTIPANELDCVVLQITIPMEAETARLNLNTALGDTVPAGYEKMISESRSALAELAQYREDGSDDSTFDFSHAKAESALLTWDTVQ